MRRCIGCMESKPKGELVRLVYADGVLKADRSGRSSGRGAYLCTDPACLARAVKKRAFARAFQAQVRESDIETVSRELEEIIAEKENA